MGTHILRPNATNGIPAVHAPNITGGSANYQSAVNDSNDSTYLQYILSNCGVTLGINALTLSTGEFIQQYRIVVRLRQTGVGSFDLYCNVTNGTGGGVGSSYDYYNGAPSSFTTFYGAWKTTDPNTGRPLTISSFNDITLWDHGGGGTDPQIADVYVEVQTNSLPSATGTLPNTTLLDNSRPTFGWSYSDPDGDLQAKFQVRVFNSAQIAGVGFDPNPGGSTAFVESGEVTSGGTSWQVPNSLPNGTYRAYIFVADNVTGVYSSGNISGPYAWATINVIGPATPNLDNWVQDNSYAGLQFDLIDSQNMMDDASSNFESGSGTANWIWGLNSTTTRKTSNGRVGSNCLKMVAGSAGDITSATAHNVYPVQELQFYSAALWVYSIATARNFRIDLQFWDSGGSLVGTVTGHQYQSIVGQYVMCSVGGSAPAGTAYVGIDLHILSCASGEEHNVDCAAIYFNRYANLVQDPYLQEPDGNGDGLVDGAWNTYLSGGTDPLFLEVNHVDYVTYLRFAGQQIQMFGTNGNGGWRGLSQGLNTPNGASIVASVWVMVDDLSTGTTVNVYLSGTVGSSQTSVTINTPWQWTRIDVYGTTSSYTPRLYIRSADVDKDIFVGNATVVDGVGTNIPLDGWTRGGLLDLARFELQRTDQAHPLESDWTDVTRLDVSGLGVVDVSMVNYSNDSQALYGVEDYEPPLNTLTYYRLRVTTQLTSTTTVSSHWIYSPGVATQYLNNDLWLLKDPYEPGNNYQFEAIATTQDGSLSRQRPEVAAFFNPIGRTRSVKVSDVIQGDIFPMTFAFHNLGDSEQFDVLRGKQSTLLLVQAGGTRQWYVAFQNQVQFSDVIISPDFYQTASFTFEEQDAPA